RGAGDGDRPPPHRGGRGDGGRRPHHRRQDRDRAPGPARPTGTGSAAAVSLTTPPNPPLPLPAEVEDLLLWLAAEQGRAPATLEAYRRDLRSYAAWLAERGRSIPAVTEADV